MTKKKEVEETAAGPEVPPLRSAETPARLPPIPIGYRCAPPPPPPPEYLRVAPPVRRGRPDGWVCRRCTEWWEWHPYRPPTERELDIPCAECRKAIDADERTVEVNRLLLARLSAGKRLTVAMQISPAGSQPVETPEINPSLGIACTVKEAGTMLGCGATKVYALLSQGRLLPAEKFGRKRMILRSSVEALSKAGGINSTPEPPRKATPVKPRAKDAKSLAAAIAKLSVK